MRYVLSDLHGHGGVFRSMLAALDLKAGDELYILGDAIDRGPDGVEILQHIKADSRIHFIPGNHEMMMLDAYDMPYEGYNSGLSHDECNQLWRKRNGGEITYKSMCRLTQEERSDILEWLLSLPIEYKLEQNGERIVLCHAVPEALVENYPNFFDGFSGKAYHCVWDRNFLECGIAKKDFSCIFDLPIDTVICGHTPVVMLYDGEPQILRIHSLFCPKLLDIDCGAVFTGVLAAYCLDTGESFYVKEQPLI